MYDMSKCMKYTYMDKICLKALSPPKKNIAPRLPPNQIYISKLRLCFLGGEDFNPPKKKSHGSDPIIPKQEPNQPAPFFPGFNPWTTGNQPSVPRSLTHQPAEKPHEFHSQSQQTIGSTPTLGEVAEKPILRAVEKWLPSSFKKQT